LRSQKNENLNFILKVAAMGWDDHQNVGKGVHHDKNHSKRYEGRDPTIGLVESHLRHIPSWKNLRGPLSISMQKEGRHPMFAACEGYSQWLNEGHHIPHPQ
jgi:hypothetical protein